VGLRRTGRGICAYRERGVVSYGPRCLSPLKWQFAFSKTPSTLSRQISNTPNSRMPPPRCPWATRPIHARCPKHLPLVLGVVGAGGVCSKSKLPTTHNHHHHRRRRHHHLLLELLLKVLTAARVIFKRLNPVAAKDGAEDVLVVRPSSASGGTHAKLAHR